MNFSIRAIMIFTAFAAINVVALYNPINAWAKVVQVLCYTLIAAATTLAIFAPRRRIPAIGFFLLSVVFLFVTESFPKARAVEWFQKAIYRVEAAIGSTDYKVLPEGYYDVAEYGNGTTYIKREKDGGWMEVPRQYLIKYKLEGLARTLSVESDAKRRNFEQIVTHLTATYLGFFGYATGIMIAFIVRNTRRKIARKKGDATRENT